MPENAKVLSYSMVSSSLLDPNFYNILPEFKTLSPKLAAINVDITKPGKCKGCQKRRIESNLFKDYLHIVQTLDANGINRLKSYFKIDKIMLNIRDLQTNAVSFKAM